MKKSSFIILTLLSPLLWASENEQLAVSKMQLYNLGIKTDVLKIITDIPFLNAPAVVTIPPEQERIVSTPQSGLIHQLMFNVGDKVKRGQVVAQINSPELLSLQQKFLRANSERQLALVNYQRDKKLLDEGIIARKRWQESRSVYESRNLEVKEREQLLTIAGMSKPAVQKLARNRRLNSQLDIYAPISGVILERIVTIGERLDMLAPLYRIANLDQLWLEIKLPQEQAEHVNIGDQVLVENSAVSAKITLIAASVNADNQTVLARALIHRQKGLRAGQHVNTQIIQSSQQTSYRVPNVAIAQNEGQSYIFIRTETGFDIQAVKILSQQADYSAIAGDLEGDEEIAIRGAAALKANWLNLGGDE